MFRGSIFRAAPMEEKMVAPVLEEATQQVLLVREEVDSVHDVVILFKVKRFGGPFAI